jgi:purine nucleosidase
MNMKKKNVYIDTDLGLGTTGAEIDDGAALIALLRSEVIQPIGIGSVFGNVPLVDANVNIDRLISFMERKEIAIGWGGESPLEGNMDWFSDWQKGYGETLPWKAAIQKETAVDLLIRLVKEKQSPITVLGIGPMTNLAAALSKAPEIIKKVDEIVVMGGSFLEEESPPEFNILCDPYAANSVLNSELPLVIIGLEVTRKTLFSRKMFRTLRSGHPAIELLRDSADRWIDRVEGMGWESGGCSLHDAIAAAYIIDPSLFKTIPITSVAINLEDGPKKGSTTLIRSKDQETNIKVVVDVDVPSCRELIWSLIDQ